VLLFEGGEAFRYDPIPIEVGARGVLRVLARLGIIKDQPDPPGDVTISRETKWIRAPRSGIVHLDADLGSSVREGDTIATIYDPFGKRLSAPESAGPPG
jgi:predicted deacylase